ncbi:MAG TPA: ECF-type sigma factor [Woeseiaceae bacterium]|jgi:RNA polymerase sigma factor (TIGR02999 family)|nr:ECF-type sigma factor [Woeseiaceae bacterium]
MNKNPVTRLVEAAARGEPGASDELLPLVYDELRKLAHARMRRERPGHTLQPTGLVHEAYLRLVGSDTNWENRRHFFAAAAETMRRILIERARRYAAIKHGGELRRTELDDLQVPGDEDVERLVAWDQLLDRLQAKDAVMADVVKLRTFVGFTIDEIAQALEISPRTVNRHWSAAQAWLRVQLERREPGA